MIAQTPITPQKLPRVSTRDSAAPQHPGSSPATLAPGAAGGISYWLMVMGLNGEHPAGQNPLSLDMGWKEWSSSELAFQRQCVAIRFRWIWVGKSENWVLEIGFPEGSQSAFAGYGLEELVVIFDRKYKSKSQSAFAGYGLEEPGQTSGYSMLIHGSQSAFAGYGLEEEMIVLI